MDDPLRLVVDNGKLFARIEAGSSFGTPGVPVGLGRWHHVAAAKRGAILTLFMDGLPVGSSAAPEFSTTTARDCALGAGTAVAFATVYAAYALYGFLVPATAFILLGLVAMGTLAAALLGREDGGGGELLLPDPADLPVVQPHGQQVAVAVVILVILIYRMKKKAPK